MVIMELITGILWMGVVGLAAAGYRKSRLTCCFKEVDI